MHSQYNCLLLVHKYEQNIKLYEYEQHTTQSKFKRKL